MKNVVLTVTLALLSAAAARADELRVGAAAVVITPPLGTPLAGYYALCEAEGLPRPNVLVD